MDHFEDEQIVCADCGATFVFSGGEAAFYAERNLAFPPKRCKECRAVRKSRPSEGGSPRGPVRGAPPPRGAGAGGGERPPFRNDARRPPRYTGAVNEYRSPMQDNAYAPAPSWGGGAGQPRGDAPRRDGFRPARGGAPNDGNYRAPAFRTAPEPATSRGPARGRPRSDEGRGSAAPQAPRTNGTLFDITCMTCGTRAQVPFRPIEGRDVFCQACYRARKPLRDPID